MALAWLKDKRITSVLIGASSVGQLNNNIDSLQNQFYSNWIRDDRKYFYFNTKDLLYGTDV
jgi:aryl-alcohol dehydrogenase-like predicted oxidoreductase